MRSADSGIPCDYDGAGTLLPPEQTGGKGDSMSISEQEAGAPDRRGRATRRSHRLGRSATTRSSGYSAEAERRKGSHRVYGEADVQRLQEMIRLRDLLGLSLDELVEVVEAEDARRVLCSRWETNPDDDERLQIILAATPLVERAARARARPSGRAAAIRSRARGEAGADPCLP